MANLITLIRLISAFVIGAIALYANSFWQLINPPLIIINILLDGLDGIIARMRNETSIIGAVFDIAADRIIEITLWIILAFLGETSVWIPIIFLTRGILVDSIRKPYAYRGKLPFSVMRTPVGKFLVASRIMRFMSGFIKLVAFAWLFFLIPATELWPNIFLVHISWYNYISNILIFSAVAICLARGIPVVLEALAYWFDIQVRNFNIR
ncbi:MAG: CDP-alcohol phosphatidyltransferase family protein [Coxiellaceae bacterium]|jgi:CDP-diacylglycerol--glycerol-3-phosphate 3-phosphatidyltransferase|nr:CDP-alcohol phosphatidyltransferase family protein [Coxiellaceae bacterium]